MQLNVLRIFCVSTNIQLNIEIRKNKNAIFVVNYYNLQQNFMTILNFKVLYLTDFDDKITFLTNDATIKQKLQIFMKLA